MAQVPVTNRVPETTPFHRARPLASIDSRECLYIYSICTERAEEEAYGRGNNGGDLAWLLLSTTATLRL